MSLGNPIICAINATTPFAGKGVHTFLAVTAGTVTIKKSDGTVVLDAFPVVAGQWFEPEMFVDINGGTITTAGGASGTATIC